MAESWESYANLVGGMARGVRERAASTTRAVLTLSGLEDVAMTAGDRLGRLADEVWHASRANHELMQKLVVAEVDKAAARLGFVRAEEFEQLRAEVAELRESVRATRRAAESARKAPGKRAPARKAAMKKAAETAATSE